MGRLYLSPMFGHILISDARKVVLYSLTSGRVLNTIHYHKYKRLSRELDRGRFIRNLTKNYYKQKILSLSRYISLCPDWSLHLGLEGDENWWEKCLSCGSRYR